MGDFTAEWLALREPADHRARSARLTREIACRLTERSRLHILDLGSGTGSNLRYLTRRLPQVQHWRLVDRDRALLAQIGTPTVWAIVASVHLQPRDLTDLEANDDLFTAVSLVTASALLDLVSAAWVDALAQRCHSSRAAALFALSYDGRIACTPADGDDDMVRDLVNRHQRTDKGFGPALGPDAADVTHQAFASRGFTVARDRSDWTLDAGDAALQRELIDGWAAAAVQIQAADGPAIEAWRQRRLEHVEAARSAIVVGHEDLAAWIK